MMKKNYKEMTKPERQAEYAAVKAEFEGVKALHLELNMARGKPSRQQLDMVTPMLQVLTQPEQFVSDGVETRNYGEVAGIPAARKLFADILGCKPEQVFVGGNVRCHLQGVHPRPAPQREALGQAGYGEVDLPRPRLRPAL